MLKVHFLNVGHGDCTIIRHPDGRLTMIDINNAKDFDPTTAQELGLSGGRIASSNFSFMGDIYLTSQGNRLAKNTPDSLASFDKG
jgi:hypothetical protein